MLTQLEIVDVRSRPTLPHEHKFMLGTVERAHAAIGLVPDSEIFHLKESLKIKQASSRREI
jgi:hypothetical protein